MLPKRSETMALILLLWCGGMAKAENESFSLRRTNQGSYDVQLDFRIRASTSTVWNVLTDYDHLTRIVPTLRVSRVTKTQKDFLLLEQEGASRVLGFIPYRAHVILKVHEIPPLRIVFEDSCHQSFAIYKGSWEISPSTDGTVGVRYELEASPTTFAPHPFVKAAFQRMVQSLATSLQSEMRQRVASGCPCGCDTPC